MKIRRLARRQQLLAGELRRGVQVERRRAPSGPISSVAKACRCASLPGETCRPPVSTSTKPCALEPGADGRLDPVTRQQDGRRRSVGDAAATRGRARSWPVDLDEWKSVADGAKLATIGHDRDPAHPLQGDALVRTTYPIGAQAISRLLADVPQFAEITLEFASRDHLLLRGPTDELLLMEANHFRRPKTMFDGPATRAYLQQPHWNVQCIQFSGATRAQSAR